MAHLTIPELPETSRIGSPGFPNFPPLYSGAGNREQGAGVLA
jgi:hypothetical protein